MLDPLRFEPVFRRYLWGGRRLESLLGKSLGPGEDYAEAWEIVDHGQDQSVVAGGPLAGTTLNRLVVERGDELLGVDHPAGRFPLLFKYLDAHRDLSVQVHPDDLEAARLDPPDLGKTEAWYVVHAEPGATLYAGLLAGVDRPTFEEHLRRGTVEKSLHQIHPAAGDCVLIPAGTVHAIGAGLVVAEIQQASDTTFRLFDWNRLGADGQPRPLQVERALDAADFQRGPVAVEIPRPARGPHAVRLTQCHKFIMDRWEIRGPAPFETQNRCWIVSVLNGALAIDGLDGTLVRGQTALIPAVCGSVTIDGGRGASLLAMSTGDRE